MSKINVLDSSVFNRIAAGEVVERPCSIVKELVENSIDAGADIVTVEIKNGGLSQIRVVDNGCGMDAEDLEKAFLPHATSKIKDLSDLNAIATLGFRGEALTSISSVAKITVTSKTKDDEVGNYIVIENGKILEKGEKGCSQGTTVLVEDLFKNIPARAKFLSKPSTEESVITDMMTRLIMTNHGASIKYSVNGKVIYQSSGNGLKNAIYTVYGKAFTDNMVEIECIMSDITLRGYINKPYFTKPNRTYQTLIVNNRYVVSSDISMCAYNCYRDYLMKRQFPVYILALDIPHDMVDVNVHPNKLEVKFADFDNLKKAVYKTINNKLHELTLIPKEIAAGSDNTTQPEVKINKYRIDEDTGVISKITPDTGDTKFKDESETKNREHAVAKDYERTPKSENDPKINYGTFFKIEQKKDFGNATIKSPALSALGTEFESKLYSAQFADIHKPDSDRIAPSSSSDSDLSKPEPAQMFFADNAEIVTDHESSAVKKFKTVLFDTYIVIEENDCIYLIDQHAAHERLLYDKLSEQLESKTVAVQDMLVPHVFNVSPTENEILNEKLGEINSCGFGLSFLGGFTYSLSAVPLVCADMNVDRFMELALGELSSNKYRKLDFVKDILMQSACKAAVKGEDKLNDSEIEYLIDSYSKHDKVLMCPHGRPLVVKITKSEIEKWFKRVV